MKQVTKDTAPATKLKREDFGKKVNAEGTPPMSNTKSVTLSDYDRVIKSKLTNYDHWYVCNLKALIGGEETLVKRGIKKYIDKKMIAKWAKAHTKNDSIHPS